jgi:ribosomal protein L11 methyltransferase
VLADLLELALDGVEEIELPGVDGGEDLVEYAVYGAPGELPELPDLQAAAAGALVDISTSEVPDDWAERWKRFHRPVLVEGPGPVADHRMDDPDPDPDPVPGVRGASGSDLVMHGDGVGVSAEAALRARVGASLFVRPPWEATSNRPGALEVVIDPAQAFGTGAHATTRLCLQLLLELAAEGVRGGVLDVGAGSGVLAIAAAKLGYGPVLALDNDRASVAAIADNAARNGVQIEARRFDLRRDPLPEVDGLPAPIVLANLLRPLLLDLAETMLGSDGPAPPAQSVEISSSGERSSPGGELSSSDETPGEPALPSGCDDLAARLDLIASGLLCEQADEVAQAFARRLGLRERARRERGEWAALWLTSARLPHAPLP